MMHVASLARSVVVLVVPALLLLSNILFFSFYPAHYHRLWDRHDVPARTELSHEELDQALTLTLGYLRGERALPELVLERDGSAEPLYGPRAAAHLVDVRDLFQQAFFWRLSLAAAAAVGLLMGLCAAGRRRLWLGETLRLAGWFSLAGAAVLVIPFLLDFHRVWDLFHEVFFANQLWRLSLDERMLQMFPSGFFLETIVWIGGLWLVQVGLMLAVGHRLKRAALARRPSTPLAQL